MSNAIRIWTCAAYSPVYRCGGWAAVRAGQGLVTGAAGGERATTARRMALSGLAAALRDLGPSRDPTSSGLIGIETTSPELAAFARFLSGLGDASQGDGPDEDLDLWAQIAIAAKGRRLSLVRTPLEDGTPIAFATAWAELAQDKAKATGAFASAIPKPNLAKIPGLDRR